MSLPRPTCAIRKRWKAGRGGPVTLFARNRLCGLARPEVKVETGTLLDVMLNEGTRLGTSTPKADPAGDYAFALFEKSGHADALKAKALQLTGGPDSASPPEGRNAYAWVLDSDQADLFLTYCTNAVLAKKEVPDLQIVHDPRKPFSGGRLWTDRAERAPEGAQALADYILSPEGQAVLADYGFVRRTEGDMRYLLMILALLALPAQARTVTDSAGRVVEVPDDVTTVFAAGPPASVLVYVLKPEALTGWPRALRPEERAYIAEPYRDIPETGRLTGRGGEANLERVLEIKPDLIVDFGSSATPISILPTGCRNKPASPIC